MMKVALIDYDSGNLHSAQKAVALMGHQRGVTVETTNRAEVVAGADMIILPGDGAFPACRAALDAVDGMVDALEDAVLKRGVPFLGICVGMQLLADTGHEYRQTPGLGWIGGQIRKISPEQKGLKVPHMGWNDLQIHSAHPVLAGISSGEDAYFVHSWQFHCDNPAHVIAEVDYGGPVTAIVGRDNIIGTQFHPEKSQQIGLQLIGNFLDWRP